MVRIAEMDKTEVLLFEAVLKLMFCGLKNENTPLFFENSLATQM